MKTLLTPRLSIAPFTLDDAPFIIELLNDPGWLRYIGDKNIRTLDDARAYLRDGPMKMMAEHGIGLCIVKRRSDGVAIGTCGLIQRDGLDDVDLGFAFLPEARGQGLGTEAAVAVLTHGLHNLGLKRIVAITTLDNEPSGKLLERIGMRLEGNTRLPGADDDLKLYGVEATPEVPDPLAVDLPRAYRLINHGPTVLVSAAHAGRRNTMAVAWNMGLDFDPPKVAVVLDKAAYTRTLIEASGRFVLALPTRAQAALTSALGGVSGRDVDKEAELGLRYVDAGPQASPDAPCVAGCVAWLHCKLLPEPHIQQAYDLFLGEVLAAWADPRVYSDGRWHFDGHDDLRTLHHVAGGHYFLPGESVGT